MSKFNIHITPSVYPNWITVNQSVVITLHDNRQYEFTVEGQYSIPDDNTDMEHFIRENICVVAHDPSAVHELEEEMVKEIVSRVCTDAERWLPKTLDCSPQYKHDLPKIPPSMDYYLYEVENTDEPQSLAQVLARFLCDQDEELLSPSGVYNLFCLEVGESIPEGDISYTIKRIQ